MVDGAARRWGTRLLIAGGVLSAVNGAGHLLLPVVYPWGEHVAGLYEPVRWALYATTVFFAVLLTLCGALTVLVARASAMPPRVVGWVAAGMAAFWVLGAAYEVAVPFPAPGVDWALPVFSLLVALLYAAGGWLRRRAGPYSGAAGRGEEGGQSAPADGGEAASADGGEAARVAARTATRPTRSGAS